MEWRIIVPVLCLIGILHVPGNAAQTSINNRSIVYQFRINFSINDTFLSNYTDNNNNATIELKKNIITQVEPLYRPYSNFERFDILRFSNGSIVTEGELKFSNGTKPNVTDLGTFLKNGTFTFTIIKESISITDITPPPAPAPVTNQTEAAPAKVAKINLLFKIEQDFKDIYSNLSDPETKSLSNNIITQLSAVYKKRFPKFYQMVIQKFSKGSVAVDSVLEFDATNGSSAPNVSDVKDTLTTAISNRTFSFTVNSTSIGATDITDTNATTAAPVTTQTVAPTEAAPAKVARINLLFKIEQDFKDIYSNLNDSETKSLSNNIITQFSAVYKKRFQKFYQMIIRKFSKGSVAVDSVLEFDTTNGSSAPNVSDVKDTLTTAISNGNFSFTVNSTSISATDITDANVTTATASTSITTQATTVSAASALKDYNITFKMNEVFSSDLSNMASAAAIKLANNVTTELNGFCKGFKNFNRSLVWQFRNGSVVVDALLGFINNGVNPTVTEMARGIAEAVRNGTIKLTADPKSINVTDTSTGQVANRSPVLASMLTALWMTLASLLLSAVMH